MNQMKRIGLQMSILMGATMSLGMSIVGNLTGGGQRPLPAIIIGILVSFICSFIISLIIGFVVPMKKVGDKIADKMNKPADNLGVKTVSSLVSDLIYTPIITLAMIALARKMAGVDALAHMPPFVIMFGKSLVICLVVGWILCFIFQPLYSRVLMKKIG